MRLKSEFSNIVSCVKYDRIQTGSLIHTNKPFTKTTQKSGLQKNKKESLVVRTKNVLHTFVPKLHKLGDQFTTINRRPD